MNRRSVSFGVQMCVLTLAALIVLYPLFLIVSNSLKSKEEFARNRVDPPKTIAFENYAQVWREGRIPETTRNSFLIALFSLAGQIVIGSLAAYALTKMGLKRAETLSALFLLPMIFSSQLVIIPLFLMFRALRMLNTVQGIVLIYIAGGLPLTIYMLSRFMNSVPNALTESARIDGANHFTIYSRIIMPLTKVALSTLIVINGLGIWNDFFLPYMFFTSSKLRTLPLNTYLFREEHGAQWHLICTNMVFTITPVLVVYLFLQKFIISGVVAGAVKG